jgi:elongation factor Ts
VKQVAENVATCAAEDVPAFLCQPLHGDASRTIGDLVQEKIAFIKENIVVRRFARFQVPAGQEGLVAAYIHPPAAKVGVLVELESKSADKAALAKDVAMHAAAASPAAALYVSRDEVPADVLAKEKEIYREQALASGKPAAVVDKIAEGKMKEYYATYCLVEQPYIREPKITLGQHLGGKAVVKRFARFRLGEESGAK